MEYSFKVFIDGNYYQDNEIIDVEIPLTEDEVAVAKRLVGDYKGNLEICPDDCDDECAGNLPERGLMPILKAGSETLYRKFYDAIYPRVFFELFDLSWLDEPNPGDLWRSWSFDEDIDYMMEKYGDSADFSEAFMCYVPAEWTTDSF